MASRQLADRRAGPTGRAHGRHDPLLRPRGPAPGPGQAGPPPPLRPRPPRPARPDPRAPEQRFSLAAIRAIVDVDRPGLEGLFATTGPRVHARRADRPRRGRRPSSSSSCARSASSPTPPSSAATSYDDTDLGLLARDRRAAGDRHDRPRSCSRSAASTSSTSTRCSTTCSTCSPARRNPEWDRRRDRRGSSRQLTANSQRMMPAVDQVLNYVHQRTLQRLTLEAATSAAPTRETEIAEERLERRVPRAAPRCRP